MWIRPWPGNNVIRTVDCGGRSTLIAKMAQELKAAEEAGGDTTLMVWADLDHDMADGESLKNEFWRQAQQHDISRTQFDQVVFVFAKDRIENWIEFLTTGATDESLEGPRLRHGRDAADAARLLAEHCRRGAPIPNLPPSLDWSCRNWRALVARMC